MLILNELPVGLPRTNWQLFLTNEMKFFPLGKPNNAQTANKKANF